VTHFDTEHVLLHFRCLIPLPQLTEDYDRVTLMTYLDQDPSKYFVYDVIKLACMVSEIRLIEDYNLSEIIIIDLNNITVGHAVKYTLPVIKKLQLSVKVSSKMYIRTPLIRTLVVLASNYQDRLGPSGKFVKSSTKLTCFEITGYRIKYSKVLRFLELQIRRCRKV